MGWPLGGQIATNHQKYWQQVPKHDWRGIEFPCISFLYRDLPSLSSVFTIVVTQIPYKPARKYWNFIWDGDFDHPQYVE